MKSEAIQINNLSFGFNGRLVLENLNFKIMQGEYVSIIGPNGAGKSTLLKCLNRILKTSRGQIEIMGKALENYSQKELGKVISYVPQNKETMLYNTVYEFVMMGRFPYLNPFSPISSTDKQAVEQALVMTGLQDLRNRLIKQLSGGQQQKVYLAAGLAQGPRILLLDEPTTHLDPQNHVEIQHMIADISKKMQITILHVTHDLNHIFYWSQRILAMKDKKIVYSGSPSEVMTGENLKNLFEADFLRIPHPATKHDIIIPEVHK